jgi:hypothetical protein
MSVSREVLHKANSLVEDVRLMVMKEIERLLPVSREHTFNPETSGLCINLEEDSTRLQVVSMTQIEVTLEDETTFDIDDIGTDDLLTILDTLETELYPQ